MARDADTLGPVGSVIEEKIWYCIVLIDNGILHFYANGVKIFESPEDDING